MLYLCCCNRERRLKKKQLEAKNKQNEEKLDSEVSENISSETSLLETARRKPSVWQQSNIAEPFKSLKLSAPERQADNLDIRPNGRGSKEVSLFNIAESKLQNLSLEKIYGHYMTRIRFNKRFRSPALNTAVMQDFDAIIRLYKQFEITDDSDEKMVLSDDEFKKKFLHKLFHVMPLSELELKTYLQRGNDSEEVRSESISGDCRWLKLMSWYKFANSNLPWSCQKLHNYLRNSTEYFDLKNDQTITVLRKNLNHFLMQLNLTNSTAEVSAIKIYVYFPQKIPDLDMWPICQENAFRGFQENFFQNVTQDSLWTYFLKECSNHALNLLNVVMKFVFENEKISNTAQKIRNIVKNLTEKFYYLVVHPLMEEEGEINLHILIEAAQKNFKSFLYEVRVKKNTEHGCNFETIVSLTSKVFVTQMTMTVKTFQELFYTSSGVIISRKLISKYLNDIITNGIILAKKALEKDLLSHSFLKQLNENEHFTHTDILFERSVKFAYILVSCYNVVKGKETFIFHLPLDYDRYDFVNFLNDIQLHSNRLTIDYEILPIEFTLKLRAFQEQLIQKLGKSLSKITRVSNSANVLLSKAKYFQTKLSFE